MKAKILLACSILVLCASQSSGFSAQDADATLPKKPARSESTKESSKKSAPGDSGSNVKKTGATPRRSPDTGSVKVTKRPPGRTQRPESLPGATLTIIVDPPDSIILINDEVVNYRDDNGAVTLNAGSYTVKARKAGYADAASSVILTPGQTKAVELSLSPLPGTLNITTDVNGAQINISGVGTYDRAVSNLSIPPGQYEATITKPGYETIVRQVTVRPSDVVNLKISMELVKPPPPKRDVAMSLLTSNEGKYMIVSLTGSSGETYAKSGSIEVNLTPADSPFAPRSVSGLLTGFPCRVDFVPLENVAEYSFKEAPGVHNQWRTVAVRLRLKNANRPARFLINWQVLQRNGE